MQFNLQNHLQEPNEDLHHKNCELACLGSLAAEMTLDEFVEIQKYLAAGMTLKKSVLSLKESMFTNRIKTNPELINDGLKALEICRVKKFNVIYPGHALFPESLLEIDRPPKLLTYIGEPAWLTQNKISVVGSREMSPNARQWMELYFNIYLQKSRSVTVSGAAFGIDQLVHSLSVRNLLPTIAFLPSGLDQIYPRRFAYDIVHLLATKGAVVSEFLPNVEMKKHHFERRNRLISGVSRVLFVVEARRKSGSILTARLALSQGKTLCVLPSSPQETRNLGNLDLLFDGAHPLRDEKDLFVITGARSL